MSRRRKKKSPHVQTEPGAEQAPTSWSPAAKAAWQREGGKLNRDEWAALKRAVIAREREAEEALAPLRAFKALRTYRGRARERGIALGDYVAQCVALEEALVRSPLLGVMLVADRLGHEFGVDAGAFEPFAARVFHGAARLAAARLRG